MTFATLAASAAERMPVPDRITRAGIYALVERTRRALVASDADAARRFADGMHAYPIAMAAADANAQHYEVPAAFFDLVLGPQRKYSCCLFPTAATSLTQAEELALTATAQRADLRDGQTILELGCGWGSLTLWMAAAFPDAKILAVSNSRSQRAHILRLAQARGLHNIEIVTADVNTFRPDRTFDRVVSVEMFEHMANWAALLGNIRTWLKPDGRLFVHVFAHRSTPYRFDHTDRSDWIAQHFFTGGLMPSRLLMYEFGDRFEVDAEWWWNGTHYARTADAWLANFDRNAAAVRRVLEPVYGSQTSLWMRRWRLFFLATSGLFGHANGNEWGVAHYLLKPAG